MNFYGSRDREFQDTKSLRGCHAMAAFGSAADWFDDGGSNNNGA